MFYWLPVICLDISAGQKSTDCPRSPRRLLSVRPTTLDTNGNVVCDSHTSAELPTINLLAEPGSPVPSRASPVLSVRRASKQWGTHLAARPAETDAGAETWSRSTIQSFTRRVSPRERPEHAYHVMKSPQTEKRPTRSMLRGSPKKVVVDTGHYERFARKGVSKMPTDRSPSNKLISVQYSESRKPRSPQSPRRLSPSRFKRRGSVETGQSLLAVGGDQPAGRGGIGGGRGIIRRKSYDVPQMRGSRSPTVPEEREVERFGTPLATHMPLSDRSSSSNRDCLVVLPAISPPLIRRQSDGTWGIKVLFLCILLCTVHITMHLCKHLIYDNCYHTFQSDWVHSTILSRLQENKQKQVE